MCRFVKCYCFLIFVFFAISLPGQQSAGGYPLGLAEETQQIFSDQQYDSFEIPGFTDNELKNISQAYNGSPLFAFPVLLKSKPEKKGHWFMIRDQLIWRLVLEPDNPRGLIITYRNFELPDNSFLFIYNEDGSDIHGAFSNMNNRESKKFMTGPIKGKRVVIEYITTQQHGKTLPFELDKIYVHTRMDKIETAASGVDTGFEASYTCHKNINCSEGDNLQDQKRGVVRIMMVLEEGIGFCTGSLVNNARQDGTPYVLSALHCNYGYTPEYDLWRFDFGYESSNCDEPLAPPARNSLLGCIHRADGLDSDFHLLELTEKIPGYYNVYFNGWNRSDDYSPEPSSVIHHPAGDIKKIAVENDELIIFGRVVNWDNGTTTPPNSHFRCDLDIGGHQAGSSGAPMFDQDGFIIGQLHGGTTEPSCEQTRTYIGRFAESWDLGEAPDERLSDWLDPENTGIIQLPGKTQVNSEVISISGNVATGGGKMIPNVQVQIIGVDPEINVLSDVDGNFTINDIDVSQGQTEISFELNTAAVAGISAVDIIQIRNHILGLAPFAEEYRILASDANKSGTISAVDLIQIQNVLLGFWDSFPNSNSWGFIPEKISLGLGDQQAQFNITGYKLGDVNGSVNPGN